MSTDCMTSTPTSSLDDIPEDRFVRTEATGDTGYSSKIRLATEGTMQMHLATRELDVAFRNGQVINPVQNGHIAFRTDDLAAVLKMLDDQGIPYSDYGTTFSKEWHQVFFQDPEGNVVEVHQQVS